VRVKAVVVLEPYRQAVQHGAGVRDRADADVILLHDDILVLELRGRSLHPRRHQPRDEPRPDHDVTHNPWRAVLAHALWPISIPRVIVVARLDVRAERKKR
jgi:hypothetical protein